MNNISCLLFDLDGTLFDSSKANILAYKKAFEATGLPFDEVGYRQNFGLRFDEMIHAIAPSATDSQKASILKHKAVFYKEHLDLVKPNLGLISLLRSTRKQFKTGLVTTARAENVINLLSFFNVESTWFDCILTAEDVKNGKPDPECYNTAMEKLGVDPTVCCIFEDSEVGIQAANASGAAVIRVRL